MKDRMERLVILPFTVGCVSSSSVSVCTQHGRRPKEHANSVHTVGRSMEVVKEGKSTSNDEIVKGLSNLPTPSKPSVYIGFHRLTRTIKTLSQALVFKEDVKDQDMEMEMEIGLPTDVKHVTHIGFDGPLTHGANGCNHFANFSEFISLYPKTRYEEHHATLELTHDTINTSCKLPKLGENENLHETRERRDTI